MKAATKTLTEKYEQALEDTGSLLAQLDHAKGNDERIRKEFAKAFHWYKKQNQYDYSSDYRTPTWEEIFTEVGKILAARTFMDFQEKVYGLESGLEKITQRLYKTAPKEDTTRPL